MARKANLIQVEHYLDNSWEDDGVRSTSLYWTTPAGRHKTKDLYAGGYWTEAKAEKWLEAKYRPRLSNLFGLMFYL